MNESRQGCNQTAEAVTGNLEEAKNVVLEMLEKGVCCSVIANRTGLSKEEIKKLSNHVCDH